MTSLYGWNGSIGDSRDVGSRCSSSAAGIAGAGNGILVGLVGLAALLVAVSGARMVKPVDSEWPSGVAVTRVDR